MDNFRDTSKEFYDDLAKGKADPKDFERYVYGGYANRYKDERDAGEQSGFEERQKMEREFKERVRNQQLYGKKS